MTRLGWVMTTYAAVVAIGLSALSHPAPKLIWNATASTPAGLYALRPAGPLDVADLVSVRPPEPLADLLAKRGLLPRGVPLLKRVMALPGQTVCRTGRTVTIDGAVVGEARERDSRGRDLPVWSGCRTLPPNELFLMNPDVPDSLDGRYFGPLPRSSIVGRARPLWTDETGDGRFVWLAPEH